MGYIAVIVLLVIVIPLLLMLTRRPGNAGLNQRSRGVTHDAPSSDQPTPPAGPRTDRPHRGSDRGVPPG